MKIITSYEELLILEKENRLGVLDSEECEVDIEEYEFDDCDIEDYSELDCSDIAEIEVKLYKIISDKYNRFTEKNKHRLYVFTKESNEKFDGSIGFRITNFNV
ncbi:MAG: hypothetical protein COA82_10765 [Alkaliphilus sp.]|nr:hypothetical protein [Alkaliphilus sp. AH-315-G20]MBN4074764.1 hypothetical protein [bacterium AH-315-E09]PHS30924.1 MAG: hypothetical protein COA82_10765 [Alkaliphilus sp.]